MNEPTNINEFRKRVEESPIFYIDAEGVRWNKYTADYTDLRGVNMGFHIWAVSYDDAEARLKRIGETGVIKGIIHDEIPA